MPNLNGHDTLKRMRSLKPNIPALMCTGYDPETMGMDGASDFDVRLLQKPYEPDVFLNAVREVLDTELCTAN